MIDRDALLLDHIHLFFCGEQAESDSLFHRSSLLLTVEVLLRCYVKGWGWVSVRAFLGNCFLTSDENDLVGLFQWSLNGGGDVCSWCREVSDLESLAVRNKSYRHRNIVSRLCSKSRLRIKKVLQSLAQCSSIVGLLIYVEHHCGVYQLRQLSTKSTLASSHHLFSPGGIEDKHL